MLTLTWFGLLPGRASRNIYENQNASAGERELFCQPDMEMVQRSTRLEAVSFKDLYFVRRVGYQGLDQDFTWIAKCESIRDITQDRVGAYRGAGMLLSGTAISGTVAQTLVDVVFDCMTQYVPSVLPRGFNLAAAVSHALAQRKVQDIINAVHGTVLKDASTLQDGTGLSLATGNFAVGIVDISGLQPSARPDVIARFLGSAQTDPQYYQFGELYISAEPHVIAVAKRIPNAHIIPLDWDPKPRTVAAIAPPQETPPHEVEEEMPDQKLRQIMDHLIEQMRNEVAEQARFQVKALERRIALDNQNRGAQPSGAGQGAHWSRVLGWLAAAAAVIAISASASVYLALRDGGGEYADVGLAIERALEPVKEAVGNADRQTAALIQRLEALEKRPVVATGAPALPNAVKLHGGISVSSKARVRESIALIERLIPELETRAAMSQPHVKAELNKVAETLRQSIPVMCERTGIPKDECRAPTAK